MTNSPVKPPPKPAESGLSTMDWLRPTLPIALIALFAELGYAVLNNSALPIYLNKGLGIDTAIITNVMLPFFLSELAKGPLGVLADRWGRKPLMVLGPMVTIVTPLIFVMVRYPFGQVVLPSLILFGFLRLLDGLGASALWPAAFAYLGDMVRPEKRASAMSVLNVVYMVGLALGFLAGGFVNDNFGPVLSGETSFRQEVSQLAQGIGHKQSHKNPIFVLAPHRSPAERHHAAAPSTLTPIERRKQFAPSFYLGSLLFALATITALLAVKARKPKQANEEEGTPEQAGEALNLSSMLDSVRAVPGILLLAFVTFFGIGCIALLVKLFALDELGITETEFGVLFLWPAVIIGALAIPLGHLSDSWGNVRSIRLGFGVGAVSMWAMILLFHDQGIRELALVIAGTLLGLGFVIAFPAWLAHLTTLSSSSHRGTIIGAASTAQGLGMLAGAELGGWLYRHASSNAGSAHVAPFIACGIFLTIGSVLTFFVLKQPDNAPAN